MGEMMVARQPIFDRKLGVYGYELLYRGASEFTAGVMDVRNSAQSIVNVLLEFGLNDLVGDRRAFVNIDQELLLSGTVGALPQDRVVIELLETIEPTEEVKEAIRQLRALGYTIALDDFVPGAPSETLIPFVNILKVDLLAVTPEQAEKCVQLHRRPGLMLLAEKIETDEVRAKCVAHGYDLLQGHFLCRPQLRRSDRQVAPSTLQVFNLIGKLQDPDVTLRDVEEAVASDMALTYRLLKFVNSATYAPVETISSLRQALLILGLQTVMSVAVLISLSEISQRPVELVRTGLIRAKMCEQLARLTGLGNPDHFYLVGLLSLLDAFLCRPIEEALEELPISAQMRSSLVDPECDHPFAAALRCVTAFESGAWDRVAFGELSPENIGLAYRNALKSSAQISKAAA